MHRRVHLGDHILASFDLPRYRDATFSEEHGTHVIFLPFLIGLRMVIQREFIHDHPSQSTVKVVLTWK